MIDVLLNDVVELLSIAQNLLLKVNELSEFSVRSGSREEM